MSCNSGLAWLGFWIFAAVFVACDSWIFSQGYESLFQHHKTDNEKELLRLKIEERQLSIQLLRKSNN